MYFLKLVFLIQLEHYFWLPLDCVSGRDEWFPEFQACILISKELYSYDGAKTRCESEGKVMMGAEDYQKVLHLMDLINTRKFMEGIHQSLNLILVRSL